MTVITIKKAVIMLTATAVTMSASALFAATADANGNGNWDIRKLDAARDADYMSDLEKDVVFEMNKVRSDPRKYAELYIKPMLQYYSENNRYSAPGEITVVTKEGASAAQECINELIKMEGVGPLTPEKGLYLAARDHAADQSKTGATGHDGSDGSKMTDRVARYTVKGKGASSLGENISYGKNSGQKIVISFLIDDGTPSRGHRKNIMNGVFTQIGAAAGAHKTYNYMCVIDYAHNYITVGATPSVSEPTPSKAEAAVAPAARPQPSSPQTAELDKVLTGAGGAVEVFKRSIAPGRAVAVLSVGSEHPRLSEHIVDVIAAKLSSGGRYKMVGRPALDAAAKQAFPKGMAIDDMTARWLCKSAGAQTVIVGTILPHGTQRGSDVAAFFNLELKVLDVNSGQPVERFTRKIPRGAVEGLLEE